MPDTPDITLHAYQILEEEYVALHGSISADPLRLKLPDGEKMREVEATLGWDFRLGHLKDPPGFAGYLLRSAEESEAERRKQATTSAARPQRGGQADETPSARRPEDPQLRELRAYLLEKIGAELLEKVSESRRKWGEGDEAKAAECEGQLVARLNEVLLTDHDLYSEKQFSQTWLRVSTRELGDSTSERRDSGLAWGAAAKGETRRRLNRLLLEDAFPADIERIYIVRLAAMFHRLHDADLSALCLSGGGIRSGTFALGLLQGLARHDLLKKFDYLSTVSGGGYVGSWLTAWLHRHPEGLVGVSRELKNSAPATRVDPDPKPIQNLREYSNFITPKTGLLTADTWSFAGIYLRNLLLNWLVFIPLLAAALMLPRLLLNVTLLQPTEGQPKSVEAEYQKHLEGGGAPIPDKWRVSYNAKPLVRDFFNVPVVRNLFDSPTLSKVFGTDKSLYWRHLLLLLGFGSGVWALAFVIFNRPGMRGLLRRRNPHWHKRTDQRSFIKYCLTWLLVSAACLTTYWAWSQEGSGSLKNPLAFLFFGVAFTGAAVAVAAYVLRERAPASGRPAPEPEPPGAAAPQGTRMLYALLATLVAGAVAGLLFWVFSLFDIGDPVVGYGASVRDGEIIRRPFAWADWTQWTWWGSWTTEMYVCLGVPLYLLIYWAALTAFVGMSSAGKLIDDEDREWWARFGAWLLISAAGWLALTALVIFGPLALLESPKLLASIGGLSGLVAVLLGRSSATPAAGDDAAAKSKGAKATSLLGSALPLFGAIFLGAFVALVSLGTTGLTRKLVTLADDLTRTPASAAQKLADVQAPPFERRGQWFVQALTNVPEDVGTKPGDGPEATPVWTGPNKGFDDYVRYVTPVVPVLARPTPTPRPGAADAVSEEPEKAVEPEKADAFKGAQIVHLNILHHTSIWLSLLIGALLFVAGRFLSRKINLNVFSLHGGYRNRLIRAFLGASRPPGERRPNPFTGFDPADNLGMHELRWALFDEGDFLKPADLVAGLRDTDSPLAAHLRKTESLKEALEKVAAADTPKMVEALRTELNGVLEREHLYELFPDYLKSARAQKAQEEIKRSFKKQPPSESLKEVLRSDYQLLLNRLVLEEAFPGTLRLGPPPPYKLMHVINTSLNLVGGEKLAWQQRKAEPFSFSALHSGCFRLGYRRSRNYGGRETGGVSIGTAATISGAAASSNMGYYTTSPVISLLLTLFNVRLGWWLGNPGVAGKLTYQRNRPESSVTPVLYEAFGMTNDRYEYVYLTDGGHFENLAVYEMVLRRCRFIIAADGAEDADYRFGDLGNAVRKIRIDFGVQIHFPCVAIHGRQDTGENGRGMYWAIGRIRYSAVDGTPEEEDGLLLYIKPAVYGDEPRDVLEYKKSFPAFPHQSTGDQFFDEPQFESYRALGSHIMDQLCGQGFGQLEIKDVIRRARDEMLKHCGGLDPDFLAWLGNLAGDRKADAPRSGADYNLMFPLS
ncbi:MAG TPA: patatin-like phospholipase family protein [Pyrinomonadaceae bacterium]